MRNASLFNVIAAAVAGFIGGTVASRAPVRAASPQVIRASRFELVDSAGHALARWEVDPETNSAHLRFLARGGVALDEGTFSDVGPFLRMNGRDSRNRIALELDPADKPGLMMSDERWLGRIVLGYAGSDTPDIPDTEDSWNLEFRPAGTTLPAAKIGMTGALKPGGGGDKGLLFVNGERIR
jgi:hypothetical protein